jgi:hypothetical protein
LPTKTVEMVEAGSFNLTVSREHGVAVDRVQPVVVPAAPVRYQ